MADRKIAAEVQIDVTGQEDLDTAAATVDKLDDRTADVTVETSAPGAPKTQEQLDAIEAMRKHISENPAVLDIQSDFAAARSDLAQAEAAMGNVEEAASGINGEVANIAGNVIGQVPGVDQATGQMAASLGQVASSAETIGSAATGAGTVAALAMYGIQKGADQAADRTDNLTNAFTNLAKASDAAFAKQSAQVWADMVLRTALDGKKLTDQMHDLAESSLPIARRMLDNADAIGLNANAQKILSDAIAGVEAESVQAKKTTDEYGESSATAAGKADALAGATDAAAAAAAGAKLSIHDYIAVLASIPPAKRTEIQAAIDRGDLATAERLLNDAARDRTATISVLVHGINIGAQIGAMVRAGAAAAGGSVVSQTVFMPMGSQGPAVRRAGARFGNGLVNGARR